MRMSTITPMFPYRLTPGVEDALSLFDRSAAGPELQTAGPPYNVVTLDNDHFRIVLATPGFRDADIEITYEPNRLTISGQPSNTTEPGQVVYRGFATQPFRRIFALADHVQVQGARLADQLLSIDLVREIPEAARPRRIQVEGQVSAADSAAETAQTPAN